MLLAEPPEGWIATRKPETDMESIIIHHKSNTTKYHALSIWSIFAVLYSIVLLPRETQPFGALQHLVKCKFLHFPWFPACHVYAACQARPGHCTNATATTEAGQTDFRSVARQCSRRSFGLLKTICSLSSQYQWNQRWLPCCWHDACNMRHHDHHAIKVGVPYWKKQETRTS